MCTQCQTPFFPFVFFIRVYDHIYTNYYDVFMLLLTHFILLPMRYISTNASYITANANYITTYTTTNAYYIA